MNSVFISYAHEDRAFCRSLVEHLQVLHATGVIASWHDGEIAPGEDWKERIDREIHSADIIILLVSASFLASKACRELELGPALTRWRKRDVVILPVIVRACDWEASAIAQFQVLPARAQPVATWTHQDEPWAEVTKRIRNTVARGNPAPTRPSTAPFPRPHLDSHDTEATYPVALLESIARDMRVTAEKLQTDAILGETARRFFLLDGHPDTPTDTYRCYRSAFKLETEELPYTPVSEDHCVSLLNRAFFACQRPMIIENVNVHDVEHYRAKLSCPKSAIFLLADAIPRSVIDARSVPCWKVDGEIVSAGQRVTPLMPSHGVGILARLADSRTKLVLIDGRTQIGTWVAASFLELLLHLNLQNVAHRRMQEALYQPHDFIAVVQSRFGESSYTVEGFLTLQLLWTRSSSAMDEWHELVTQQIWRASGQHF